jgi:hypothetical protein
LNVPGLERVKTYRGIHASRSDYGLSSERMVHLIEPHVLRIQPKALFDYGCGRSQASGFLGKLVDCEVFRWDPAIEELAAFPAKLHDVSHAERMVLCTYVLHHVPRESLADVLAFLAELAPAAFLAVPLVASPTISPAGVPLSTIIEPADWWLGQVREHFPTAERTTGRHAREACFAT